MIGKDNHFIINLKKNKKKTKEKVEKPAWLIHFLIFHLSHTYFTVNVTDLTSRLFWPIIRSTSPRSSILFRL